ncbi:MAG: hypothetical protein KJ597_06715 [Nanoarchaeota archaeon]|nr:hypothetical protein [Nanoarchaeota archaeon]
MKQKKKERLTKTLMIVFLLLVALGFMVPGFLDLGDEQQQYVEPRICQADADCYLMCGENSDEPVTVFCNSNLCQQNACNQDSSFPYQAEPLTFELTISGLNQSLSVNDIFIKSNRNQVQVYTSGLSLDGILKKYNYNFPAKMNLSINGDESGYYGSYVPQEGDQIKITIESIN